MADLCDVNLLLALNDSAHQHHSAALTWLRQVNDSDAVVCRITQLGFLRLLTTQAVMGEAVCTAKQAWTVYQTMMSDFRFRFMPEPKGLEEGLIQFSSAYSTSPKLWQDAYLGAFAKVSGLRLVTFDKGFRSFKGLNCQVLE